MKNGGNSASAVKAVEAVGGSVPVTLTTIDKLAVVEAVDAWVSRSTAPGPSVSLTGSFRWIERSSTTCADS